MDPDRFAEEKRRGLTIDLGYAWFDVPSGRRVAFVDVPGHERFIRNMLAGIGPVRRVLFVVAADEGWKPQSEEHLTIADLLGARGVVALTKSDLVDRQTIPRRIEEVRERVSGTTLDDAAIIPCSSREGRGMDELRFALDALTAEPAEEPTVDRPRTFIDRVFTIKGAGTIVTGTLIGGCLFVGDDVAVLPAGYRARVRGLQSYQTALDAACSVARVAVNLVGIERDDVARGDVVGRPGQWRPTRVIDARLRLVRGVEHPMTSRGAFKVYAGAAEVDARIRLLGTAALSPGEHAYARIRMTRPLVLDLFDPIVVREAGRRETVAGGHVLDLDPSRAVAGNHVARLERRWTAARDDLPAILAAERGAIRARDATVLTAGAAAVATVGEWIVDPRLRSLVEDDALAFVDEYHREHPLLAGPDVVAARTRIADRLAAEGGSQDPQLVDALLSDLLATGSLIRSARTVRRPSHDASLHVNEHDVQRLLAALERGEPTPPTIEDLAAEGLSRELIEAAARAGLVVRISSDLVLRAEFIEAAKRALFALASAGDAITVSAFRERIGTSRKYAVPLLEHFDRDGITRREGALRFVRST
jgi:selenocysteine-specific elongation factor